MVRSARVWLQTRQVTGLGPSPPKGERALVGLGRLLNSDRSGLGPAGLAPSRAKPGPFRTPKLDEGDWLSESWLSESCTQQIYIMNLVATLWKQHDPLRLSRPQHLNIL